MQYSSMEITCYDLRVLRLINGYTQQQVAFLLTGRNGSVITQSYVAKLENGKRTITRDMQAEIKRAFSLTEDVHTAVKAISRKMKQVEQGK